MTVAIFFEIFYPSMHGILTSSLNMARALMERGHRVLFVAPESPGFRERKLEGGIPVFYVQSRASTIYPGMRTVVPWSRRVRSVLRSQSVDLVHITGPWTMGAAAILAARRLGCPVVHTFHTMLQETAYVRYLARSDWLVPLFQAMAWRYFRPFIRFSSIVTAPSAYAATELSSRYPWADVRLISNGVDISRIPVRSGPRDEPDPKRGDTGPTFVFVGRLAREKSVDEVIRAMRIVADRLDAARLVIVGSGPAERFYRSLTGSLGLSAHVRFLGRVAHETLLTGGLLQDARAFVTASVTENQPMTVIEAICAAAPVIVPDVRGIREVAGGVGLLYPAGDPEALARRMIRVASDDGLFRALRRRSALAREGYDARKTTAEMEEVYRELLERR